MDIQNRALTDRYDKGVEEGKKAYTREGILIFGSRLGLKYRLLFWENPTFQN